MAKTAGFDSLNSFREYVLDDTRADLSVRTNTNRNLARKRVFSSLGYAGRSDTQNSTGVRRSKEESNVPRDDSIGDRAGIDTEQYRGLCHTRENSCRNAFAREMERLTVLAWFVSHTVPTGSTNRYTNMESPAIRQQKYLVRTVRRIKSDDIHLLISFLFSVTFVPFSLVVSRQISLD